MALKRVLLAPLPCDTSKNLALAGCCQDEGLVFAASQGRLYSSAARGFYTNASTPVILRNAPSCSNTL